MTAANRGKVAERLLKAELVKRSEQAHSAFYRLPDAHAGSFQATLADFMLMQAGTLYLLECKSTLHDFRLPAKNVSPDQVARLRLWQHAGAKAYVLIYHETINAWRVRPVDHFLNRTPSWDLRDTEPQPLKAILDTLCSQS